MAKSQAASDDATRELAAELLKRTQDLDLEGMQALFSPDVVFWSNVGQLETGLAERMMFMALEKEVFAELRIEDVNVEVFDGGYVQQCTFAGTVRGGGDVSIPTCLVVRVHDGRVVRFEEYVSTDQIEPVIDAITAHLGS
jgi:ketosteroid isomerase-like protein